MALTWLTEEEQQRLLQLARASIAQGLRHGRALPVDLDTQPAAFAKLTASFVTLTLHGVLRGCMGCLEAVRPLAQDVAENAYRAAFRDPRFAPLSEQEFAEIHVHISLLTPAEPMLVADEADLLRQLRPGVDGLILEYGARRATFLPSVWEQLPQAREFVRHLKMKAGLAADFWDKGMRVWRYAAEEIGEGE